VTDYFTKFTVSKGINNNLNPLHYTYDRPQPPQSKPITHRPQTTIVSFMQRFASLILAVLALFKVFSSNSMNDTITIMKDAANEVSTQIKVFVETTSIDMRTGKQKRLSEFKNCSNYATDTPTVLRERIIVSTSKS